MQDDDKDATSSNTSAKNQESEKFEPLLPEDEIRNIVKSFVIAWIGNEVKLNFPSRGDIKETAKKDGEKINDKTAQNRMYQLKSDIVELIYICAGQKTATPDQQRKAMNELFHTLLVYRTGDRIEGKFMHNTVKEKLSDIEENVKELNKKFEDLYFYVKSKISDDSLLKGR